MPDKPAPTADLCQHLGNGTAKATNDVVFLDCDDDWHACGEVDNCITINWLDRMHVKEFGGDAVFSKCIHGIARGVHHRPGCNDANIVAIPQANRSPESKPHWLSLVYIGFASAPDPEIHRPLMRRPRSKSGGERMCVGRGDDRQIRHCPHNGEVFCCVMARPVKAKCDTGMVTDKANRKVLVRDVSADLLTAKQRQKRSEGSNDGPKPTRGHACRGGDHALLRYSELVKAVRMTLGKAHKTIGVFEIRSESDDLMPLAGQFIKRIREDLQAWC